MYNSTNMAVNTLIAYAAVSGGTRQLDFGAAHDLLI
ncbi:hypothetical protein PAECIP111893_00088 [Paenibacillus plantiphilus]|uniref:Uncharacterized protein n=1 Tax=Paenibacillus plantiphilus TaxID=2905650 RepID=A0ABM9BLK1_9BACL|nr:hypothetical protein PAECIP111893_00088 [Paenibacillus plantiphilus]